MKRICLETTVLPVAVPNAVGPALKEINGRRLLVAQTKSPFGRTTRQTEVPIPIQVAQSRESALFAKLVEISASSLGALGLWTLGFTGNYGVTRAEKS